MEKPIVSKTTAVVQVVIIFFIAVASFNLLKSVTLPNSIVPAGASYPFSYLAVFLVLVVVSFLSGGSYQNIWISKAGQKIEARIMMIAVFPTLVIKAGLFLINWRQLPGAIAVSLIVFVSTLILARASKKLNVSDQTSVLLGILLLLCSPIPIANEMAGWTQSGYRLLYTGLVALTEEALFRGVAFARLADAFEQQGTFMDLPVDYPLLISSSMFGLWHIINGLLGGIGVAQVFAWGMWTFFAGLFLGHLRMKTGRIVIPTVCHWVINI